MYWITFWWSWPKFTAGILINKNFACLQDKVRTTEPITTQLGSYMSLVTLITWLTFCHFFFKLRMCFLNVKYSIGHISGMVGPIDVKWKGASVGYWANYVTLTFDLTYDLDLWYSRLIFKIALSQEFSLIDVKQKESKPVRYWAECMILPFGHTHDLDLVVTMMGCVDVQYNDLGGFRRRRAVDISSY